MLALPLNCLNCAHYSESFCTLPFGACLVNGYISYPLLVVCAKHEPIDKEAA